jgi:hypothetical protein
VLLGALWAWEQDSDTDPASISHSARLPYTASKTSKDIQTVLKIDVSQSVQYLVGESPDMLKHPSARTAL